LDRLLTCNISIQFIAGKPDPVKVADHGR